MLESYRARRLLCPDRNPEPSHCMPPNSPLPEALLEQIDAQKHPPVHLWHPPFSGDMDMRIQRDGQWIHEGRPILREPLVKLFASILRREGDEYFLVTPVEKWRIQIDDAPFTATSLDVAGEGDDQLLVFTTNVGDRVVCNADHPLRVGHRDNGEPAPYLHVRDNLDALISRSVFYQLVELGEEHKGQWILRSRGMEFSLGALD